MTKAEATKRFRAEVLPAIRDTFERDGRVDHPARSEAWNDWTDSLCKSGEITPRQYSTWSNPL